MEIFGIEITRKSSVKEVYKQVDRNFCIMGNHRKSFFH